MSAVEPIAAPVAGAPAAAHLDSLFDRLWRHRWLLVLGPLASAAVAVGASFAVAPVFTARTTLMPPQAQQGGLAAALGSLGSLASLAGGGAVRNTADQYVALMQSATISDRLIERFKLQQVYDERYRDDVRKELQRNVRMSIGKKDGMVSIEVDDTDPRRAAEMANRYVDELRQITANLAVTEAQQRRVFFEGLLKQSRDQLTKAQAALQRSGISAGALKAEPKAAAEGYARLRAEITATEVRLQVLRGSLADNTPEVRQVQAALAAQRAQLAQLERAGDALAPPPPPGNGAAPAPASSDYISRYRDYKYHETLFELYARQFELARVDESREGALIQVVDVAGPPERKSRPKRAFWAAIAFLLSAALLVSWALLRRSPAARP